MRFVSLLERRVVKVDRSCLKAVDSNFRNRAPGFMFRYHSSKFRCGDALPRITAGTRIDRGRYRFAAEAVHLVGTINVTAREPR